MKQLLSILAFILLCLATLRLNAQVNIINEFAGNHISGYTGDGGPATAAAFAYPVALATDAAGNVYVADLINNAIRKITTGGIVSTIMLPYPYGGPLDEVNGVAVDPSGNVYASYGNHCLVLQLNTSGVVSVYAGGTGSGYAGDGGPASAASLHFPSGLACDMAGNLYIADMENSVVRRVDAISKIITTIAGNGTHGFLLGEGGPATAAELYWAQYVATDIAGNVFVNDGVGRIRRVDIHTGIITTVAGSGLGGYTGDGGPATDATFEGMEGMAIDPAGNIYIADAGNQRVRKVNASGIVSTISGDGTGGYIGSYYTGGGYTGDGGPADSAELDGPSGFAFDASGNLYIADGGNNVIRKITPPNGIYFTHGMMQQSAACENMPLNMGAMLAVTDTTTGEVIKWNVVTPPTHGTLFPSYTTISTGGVVIPTGLNYTPTTYYTGTDSFTVKASNGSVTAYTTIFITVNAAPVLGITSIYPTICNGSTTRIIVTGNGTPGGGDTIVKQNMNIAIAPWTTDITGSTGISPSYCTWRAVPDYYSNAMGIYKNPDSSGFALSDAYGAGSSSVTKSQLISPSFSLAGYADANIYFVHSYKNRYDTSAEVDVSTDGGVTWAVIKNYALSYPTDLVSGIHPFIAETLSLRPYAGMPNLKLRFYYNSPRGFYWAVDNIAIIGYPTGIDAALWTPATDLYTDAGVRNLYATGNYRDTVYLHPTGITSTTNLTYYATEQIGSCKVKDSITITVTPTATVNGGSVVCTGSNDTLSCISPYGTWTASNSNVFIGYSTGILTGLSAGTDIITYVSAGSCGGATTFTVTVSSALPTISPIAGVKTLCAGATTILSDATGSGVWNSSSTSIVTVNSAGVANGLFAGTSVISYTVNNGCGTATAIITETVNPLPVAGTIAGAAMVCQGSIVMLSDLIPGGVWSSGATGIATISSGGALTGILAGTTSISYSVTNSCGSTAAISTMTVEPLPTSAAIAGPATVCAGAAVNLSDATPGGVWSSSTTSIATVSGAGIVSGLTPGTTVISYTITNGCGTAYSNKIITVNALPVAGTIAGTGVVCVSAITRLSDAMPGGTWSSSNTTIATISSSGIVTGNAAGTSIISYVVTNSCGTVTALKTITVNPLPIPGIITGPAVICQGVTALLSDKEPSGAWGSSNTSIATVASTGAVTGVAAGTVNISYTVSNGCGSAYAIIPMTINPLPYAGVIYGGGILCAGAITTLSDVVTGGIWTSSNTGIATIPSPGTVSGIATGTATISYAVTNSCGNAYAVTTVVVSSMPYAGTISGGSAVCVGSTVSLSNGIAGGVWSSSGTVTGTVSSTGIVTGINAGTILISYSVVNICGTATTTSSIAINPLPDAGTITGVSEVCLGKSITLSDPITGGMWGSDTPELLTVSSTGVVTGIAMGSATALYIVSNICGSDTARISIEVQSSEICAEKIKHIEVTSGIKLYPNPGKSIFTAEVTEAINETALLTVSNMAGQKIYQAVANTNEKIQIIISLPGIYLLSVSTGQNTYETRIIVTD